MASRLPILAALDIGTSKVSVVLAEKISSSEVRIVGVGTAPSRGLRKGVVINIEATVASIDEALKQAESMAGVKAKQCIASISGNHLEGLNSHGVVAIKSGEVSHEDVERVIEAAKAVAIPLDREVLHVLPQEFIIDNQDGIREPLGISGVRLEAKVHVITGSVASSQNVYKCAQRSGLMVSGVVASALSSARAVLAPEEMELGVCLIDIGGGTTDILVFHQGAVKLSAVLPLGGTHITNDIAAGLRTPVASAEEIKCTFGSSKVSRADAKETIEVPSTGDRSSRILSKTVLSEIIEPRVTEILSLVHQVLLEHQVDLYLTSGVVITGGTANLGGITETAESIFELPVRKGVPRSIGGLIDMVSAPEYAASVGLLLQEGEDNRSKRSSLSLTGGVKKVANWFRDHF